MISTAQVPVVFWSSVSARLVQLSCMQNFALALVKQFPFCSTLTSSKYLDYVWIGAGEDPVLFLSRRFKRLKVF
jgi:hypothetical protein